MEHRHRKITEIALSVAADSGFALAGGYALRVHGMGQRPSGDVDLFTGWDNRSKFSDAVVKVIEAMRDNGYRVDVDARGDTFARLIVVAPDDEEPDKVELAADWRAHPPVTLDVGPVLHPDDAVANKMGALFSRALPRDFLDIDAAITSGRYNEIQLIELARNADLGFDTSVFAIAISTLSQITDEAFTEYGVDPIEISSMRERFAGWAEHLRSSPDD